MDLIITETSLCDFHYIRHSTAQQNVLSVQIDCFGKKHHFLPLTHSFHTECLQSNRIKTFSFQMHGIKYKSIVTVKWLHRDNIQCLLQKFQHLQFEKMFKKFRTTCIRYNSYRVRQNKFVSS